MLQSAFAYRVCTSRAGDGTRIWLEGARLSANGFTHGSLCYRQWLAGGLNLTKVDQETFDSLPRDKRTKIAGTPARPIIDITGLAVKAAFPTGNVMVTYSHNQIVIRGI